MMIPGNPEDCSLLAERVMPRLQHANCAVVLSAVRVIVACLQRMDPRDASVRKTGPTRNPTRNPSIR